MSLLSSIFMILSVKGSVPPASLKRAMEVIGQSVPPVVLKRSVKSIINFPSSDLFD